MTEIISVYNIELDQTDLDGTTHWLASAQISDMVQTLAPCYNPAELSHPAEYGPGICSTVFSLEQDDLPPPIDGPDHDKIQFLNELDLAWELDD